MSSLRAASAVTLLGFGSLLALAAGVELPDTHAGRCAKAYIEAFNSGDEARVKQFEFDHRAASALKARSMDDRMSMYRELRDRWQKLTVSRVLTSEEHAITLQVDTSAGADNLTFAFDFEQSPPYGMLAIRIGAGVSPAEMAAAARPLTDELRKQSVEALADALATLYVFPERGEQMAAELRRKLAAGHYDGAPDAMALAEQLTSDLQPICNDKHLRVRPAAAGGPGDGPQDGASLIREGRDENFGFQRVERLPGNIGYVKFDAFHPSAEAQKTAAAALEFVGGCDALIFDLRDNGGGSPEMIRFISSYLFDKPTHLNSFYDRMSNQTSETWTTADVPGRRFAKDLPVYVLISGRTFSAAEEFTYNLQCLKRATIVGETSGGGAHPVMPKRLGDVLMVTLPFARAENPVTKTNWEGVGVKPDIAVPADQALEAAVKDARSKTGGGE